MARHSKRKIARLFSAAAAVTIPGYGLFGLVSHAEAQSINVQLSTVTDPNYASDNYIVQTENSPITIPVVNVNTANYDAANTADSGTIWNSLIAPATGSAVFNNTSSFIEFEVEANLPLINSVGQSSNVSIAEIDYEEQATKTNTIFVNDLTNNPPGTDGLPANPAQLMNSVWNLGGKESAMTVSFTGLNAGAAYQFFVYGAGQNNASGGEGVNIKVTSGYTVAGGPANASTNLTTNQTYRSVFASDGFSPAPEQGLSWNTIDFKADASGNVSIFFNSPVPLNGKTGFINGFQIEPLLTLPVIPAGTWIDGLNGNTNGSLWSDNTNWASGSNSSTVGVVPQNAGDIAQFNTDSTFTNVVVDSGFTVGGIIFNDSQGYTLAPLVAASGTVAGTGVLTMSNINGSAAFINNQSGTHSVNVPLILNSNLIVMGANNTTIKSNISGTGGLIVATTGSGFVSLQGSDSYTGGTTINAGATIKLQGQFAFPTVGTVGSAVLNNGALSVQKGSFASGTIPAAPVYIGQLTGTGALTIGTSGTSYLIMTPDSGPSAQNSVAGNLVSLLDITDNHFTVGALNGSFTFDNSLTGSTGTLTAGAGGLTGTYTGIIQNTGGKINFEVNGGGTSVLTNSNSYTGTTTITSGALVIAGLPALTAVEATTITADNGLFAYDFGGVTSSLADGLVLTGTGGVGQFGTDTLTLTANNSGLSGTSVIGSGTLQLGNASALGTGPLRDNSLLDLHGFSPTLGGLSGTGIVDDLVTGGSGGSDVLTLAPATGTSFTFAGVIQNTHTDTIGLTINGPGTQFLSGSNSYGGQTTITQGTLVVGAGGTLGQLGTNSNINDNGLLAYDRSDTALSININVSGNGGFSQIGSGSLTLLGSNSYHGTTTITSGALIIGAVNALSPNSSIVNNSVLTINAGTKATPVISGHLGGNGTLNVGDGTAYFKIANNTKTSTVGAVNITAGSTLDIGNNRLQINFGSPANDPVATISGELANGFNGGSWTGTSAAAGVITSSTAQNSVSPALSIGYSDGNTDSGAAGPNQIVIRYTLAGDANLDGFTNFGDLVAVIQNFNKAGTDWAHGNFTYGASTNFGDLVIVVQNFNKTLNPAGSTGESLGGTTTPLGQVVHTDAPVPEPTSLALLAAGAGGLLARRKRRR